MDARSQLAALAHGLSQQAELRIEWTAEDWAWIPALRTIRMAAQMLDAMPLQQAAGIVAHEMGHCAISRYLDCAEPTPDELPRAAWLELLNVLEDPRVECWAMRRFPGVRPWIVAQRHAELARGPAWRPHLPRHRAFLSLALREWASGWQPVCVPDPDLMRALDATRASRRSYAERLPPAGELHPAEALLATQGRELVALTRETVLPYYLELMEADILTVARGLRLRPLLATSALSDAQALRAAYVAGLHSRCEPGPARLVEARRLLWRASMMRQMRIGMSVTEEEEQGTSRRRHPRKVELVARTALPNDHQLVTELVTRLQALFPPRRANAWSVGFPSGRRLDLRAAMRAEHQPDLARQMYLRRQEVSANHAAVQVLVDLSGSMYRRGKAKAAIRAARVVSRALGQCEIACSVLGFQDETIPFQDFGEPWSRQVDERLCAMQLEVEGRRPGGHNRPGNNDDGPCLLSAYEALRARPEATKVLVVISDGRPAGRRSGPEDLHRAVAHIVARRQVTLSALGLGPGTRHVTDFYPDARAGVPIEDLPSVLSETVLRQLRRAKQHAAGRAA